MTRKRIEVPVVVSRWFAEGNGFAFSPGIDKGLLTELLNTICPIVHQRSKHTFKHALSHGRYLIGSRETDAVPLDPKAKDRSAYILKLAVCPWQPTTREEQDVQEKLQKLHLPAEPGANAALDVYLDCPPQHPQVPIPEEGFAGWWLWLLVALMGLIEFGLLITKLDNAFAGMIVRMVVLITVVFLVIRFRKPWPSNKELGKLEWQWYYNVMPSQDMLGYAAPGSMLITLDRPVFKVLKETPIAELATKLDTLRDPDNPVIYNTAVHASSGYASLAGEEQLVVNEAMLPVAFVRHYEFVRRYFWQHGQWKLTYAQWTLLDDGRATTSTPDLAGGPIGISNQPGSK